MPVLTLDPTLNQFLQVVREAKAAVRKGDYETLHEILKSYHPDTLYDPADNVTLMNVALRFSTPNQVKIIRLLVNKGADPNLKLPGKPTPLEILDSIVLDGDKTKTIYEIFQLPRIGQAELNKQKTAIVEEKGLPSDLSKQILGFAGIKTKMIKGGLHKTRGRSKNVQASDVSRSSTDHNSRLRKRARTRRTSRIRQSTVKSKDRR